MLLVLVVMLFIGLPVAFSLCLAGIGILAFQGISLQAFTQNLSLGMNSFPLLAVPFFVLAGQLMNSGGITRRVFNFANYLVGPIRGGLGQVNIIGSLIFAGMSGAAVADAAGLGQVEIKAMRDAGYDNDFSVAITAASSIIAPIIPPSIAMVVYGCTAEVSVGALFVGGIIPGLLLTAALMLYVYFIAKRRNYPVETWVGFRMLLKGFLSALPALLTPAIIIGGILGGIFTPTEAGAIASIYALVVGLFVYKELKLKDLYKIFVETMVTTSKILFIVGAAKVFGWVLTYFGIPVQLTQAISGVTTNPLLITLIFVALYLFLGCFMEAAAVITMTVPVVLPLLLAVGIQPIFFGVLLTMCMAVGTLTPPVGTVMYIMCDIGNISVQHFTKIMLPYFAVLLFVILLVAFIPQLVTFLPNLIFK